MCLDSQDESTSRYDTCVLVIKFLSKYFASKLKSAIVSDDMSTNRESREVTQAVQNVQENVLE